MKSNKVQNTALKEARKRMGYTQEQLADALCIKKSTICNWENGRAFPQMIQAILLTKLLNRTIEELFYDAVKEAVKKREESGFAQKILGK